MQKLPIPLSVINWNGFSNFFTLKSKMFVYGVLGKIIKEGNCSFEVNKDTLQLINTPKPTTTTGNY